MRHIFSYGGQQFVVGRKCILGIFSITIGQPVAVIVYVYAFVRQRKGKRGVELVHQYARAVVIAEQGEKLRAAGGAALQSFAKGLHSFKRSKVINGKTQ